MFAGILHRIIDRIDNRLFEGIGEEAHAVKFEDVYDVVAAAIDRAVASAQEQSDNNRKAFNDAEYELANANADIHRLRAQLTEAQADTKRLINAAQKVKPIVGAAVASAPNEIRPLREKAYNELCEAIDAMNQPK